MAVIYNIQRDPWLRKRLPFNLEVHNPRNNAPAALSRAANFATDVTFWVTPDETVASRTALWRASSSRSTG